MVLELRSHRLSLERPLLMGVLNATPDSFSDGGRYTDTEVALERARQMLAEGAEILDIGGESTRPGAPPVSVEEELRRVLPVVAAAAELGAPISIDTRKPEVAAAALELGAALINDVGGLRNARMLELAAAYGTPAVIVHSPVDDPRTMMQHSSYGDVVKEVIEFLRRQAQRALAAGVPEVVLDPGFGFGKNTAQNLELLGRLDELAALGHPVLVGLSRKRTIGELTGIENPAERVCGSVAAHLAAAGRGARILRVHDVAAHAEALAVWNAVEG